MLRKIKQEPVDILETSPSLLANAKSAYRNGSYSSEENSVFDSLKRKSSDVEQYARKRERYSTSDLYSHSSLSDVMPRGSNASGEKVYSCSLCEEKFSSEEDRLCHITLVHKSKSNTGRRNSTRFARHTCQICFARFRTLKDFFSHTNCHADNAGLSAIQKSINESIANNNLQRFFASSLSASSVSQIFQSAFKCDCCDRIFSNRDSYAMHVMMRVKNDACKDQNEIHKGDKEQWRKITEMDKSNGEKRVKEENMSTKSDILTPDLNKASYIDVTNATEKDEYLQSLLQHSVERFCKQNMTLLLKDPRKCLMCHEIFSDKDALAMHVMSHHTNGQTSNSPNQNRNIDDKPNPLATGVPPSFVRLIQSSTEENQLKKQENKRLCCEYCKIEFVDHDSLAMHILNHTLSEVNAKERREHSPIIMPPTQLTFWEASKELNSTKELAESPLNLVTGKESLLSHVSQQKNEKKDRYEEEKHKMFSKGKDETAGKIQKSPQIAFHMQRSASVPDMRNTFKEDLHRPASVEGMEKNYEYLFSDGSIEIDCCSDDKFIPETPTNLSRPKDAIRSESERAVPVDELPAKKQTVIATEEFNNPQELLKLIDKPVYFCRFCDIIFLNRTTFYLHKGLHNVNNPWQCNMCGQLYTNVHDFTAHIIHP
ncbi:uncharacterized protein LOC133187890 [Saccostrea echinata]|uniref:uncharacterized protein LOC133187890 n=1 Tax=Saccostrea echinata TaxID=191078 RepID=UPI002A8108B4|nr:uncharacterized protein LOC133187890 [Saccostrea echinata]